MQGRSIFSEHNHVSLCPSSVLIIYTNERVKLDTRIFSCQQFLSLINIGLVLWSFSFFNVVLTPCPWDDRFARNFIIILFYIMIYNNKDTIEGINNCIKQTIGYIHL